MTDFTLSRFLSTSKDRYLSDVRQGNGRDWIVVMGNEAGDLDSIASSIAYAWLQVETRNTPAIPLIQTNRSDLCLRPENLYALSLAGLQHEVPELLCMDDVSWTGMFPSNTFALVDHNRLLPRYDANNANTRVVAVVDHHDDEGFYLDSSKPRTIAPAGSCASHLVHMCPPQIPMGLASLLLSAIVIDTQGLKAGGKALQVDRDAAAFLLTKTRLSSSLSSSVAWQSSRGSAPIAESLADLKFIQNLTTELSEKKFTVSHLTTRDLLRRDYKQYRLNLPWVHSRPTITAGLSTVPVDFELWIPLDPKDFWSAVKQWMEERELLVLGILTSYHEKKIGKTGRGKHKRQMLWVVREGAELSQTSEPIEDRLSKSPGRVDADQLASKLWNGLEDNEILRLEKHDLKEFGAAETDVDALGMRVRIYKQGNADATRKTAAPLVKSILEDNADMEGKL